MFGHDGLKLLHSATQKEITQIEIFQNTAHYHSTVPLTELHKLIENHINTHFAHEQRVRYDAIHEAWHLSSNWSATHLRVENAFLSNICKYKNDESGVNNTAYLVTSTFFLSHIISWYTKTTCSNTTCASRSWNVLSSSTTGTSTYTIT